MWLIDQLFIKLGSLQSIISCKYNLCALRASSPTKVLQATVAYQIKSPDFFFHKAKTGLYIVQHQYIVLHTVLYYICTYNSWNIGHCQTSSKHILHNIVLIVVKTIGWNVIMCAVRVRYIKMCRCDKMNKNGFLLCRGIEPRSPA